MSAATRLLKQAQRLGEAGFRCFPLQMRDGEVKRIKAWPTKATTDPDALANLWRGLDVVAIGVATGDDWTCFDVDVPSDKHAHDGFAALAAVGIELDGPELPPTLTVTTRSGGQHRIYRTVGGARKNGASVEHPVHGKLPGNDVRGRGGYFKAHDPKALLAGVDAITDVPDWLPLADAPSEGSATRAASPGEAEAWSAVGKRKPHPSVRTAVAAVPTEGAAEPDLISLLRPVLWAAWSTRSGRQWARDHALERWLVGAVNRRKSEADFIRHWRNLVAEYPDLTPFEAFDLEALMAAKRAKASTTTKESGLRDDLDVRYDAQRAEMIAHDLRSELLYVNGETPHVWDGKRWAARGDAYAIEMVRRWHESAARSAIGGDLRADEIGRLLSRSSIAASEALLRGILAVRIEEMDADPDLLNCRNGVVDLRTRELRPHDPALRMTKITGADYRPDASHADWSTALGALPRDVASWLQVRFGQGITGHLVSDDKMVLLHGGGENGKSVLLGGIMAASGDYAAALPQKLLLGSASDHTTELTTLQGLRLGFLEELPEGRRLDVVRLKSVFGTEQITARRMRQNNQTFDATHSVFVTSNYRPEVPEVDHGTWRRLLLVEFPYTFSTDPDPSLGQLPADPGLRARMKHPSKGRAAAVLAWLVEGAARWYEQDRQFAPAPIEVEEATREWRASSDVIAGFADDALVFEQDGFTSTREMYQRFVTFLAARGRHEWSETLFAGRFESHDIARPLRKDRRSVGGVRASGWWGVSLRPIATTLTAWRDDADEDPTNRKA